MLLELTDSLKKLLKETAFKLKGASKRRFMAQTVLELGYGGQRLAERELGWNPGQTHLIVKLEYLAPVNALCADEAHPLKLTLRDNITTRNSKFVF